MSGIEGWFVKDFADGWIFFDDKADADRQVEATGAKMLAAFDPTEYRTTPKKMVEFFDQVQKDGHYYGHTPAAIRRLLDVYAEGSLENKT